MIFFAFIAGAQETVQITNGEWPPYLSEKMEHHGLASRIVTEAFQMEGIQVAYVFFPWNRSFILAREGRYHGTAVWSKNPEREQAFYISDPVLDSQYVFFHLKSYAFDWKSVNDLKGLRIGGTLQYDYGEEFEKAEKAGQIHVVRKPADEENFERVLKGYDHIFPLDIRVGYRMIRLHFPPADAERFTHHPRLVKSDGLHLLLSRKIARNQELITLFNQGLRKLKDSGKIAKYLKEI